jgi:pimeloyl-ACP methyl ester carboxylesterase
MAGAAAAAVAGAVGADLLARRAIRQFESLDMESVHLPGSRFWIHGVALHYLERGSGFPVVLVHGWGASTFSFRHTIEALAGRYRVIAVDLPGFGYSERDPRLEYSNTAAVEVLREFLRRLGVEHAVFIGHSMGGAIVQRLAVAAPDLVERLVLVSSPSAGERLAPPMARAVEPIVRLIQGVVTARPTLFRRMARRTTYDPDFVSNYVMECYMRPLRLPGSAAVVRRMMRDAAKDKPVDVTAIAAPTLLIWGEADRIVPLKQGERLHERIRGSRLEVVDGTGHLPLEEQPEATNRLILEFLERLPEPATVSATPSRTRRRTGTRPSATS